MEQTTAFFVNVLGCKLLYERESPQDDSLRDRLGGPSGTRTWSVRFLRQRHQYRALQVPFPQPERRLPATGRRRPPTPVALRRRSGRSSGAFATPWGRVDVRARPLAGTGGRREHTVHLPTDIVGSDAGTHKLPGADGLRKAQRCSSLEAADWSMVSRGIAVGRAGRHWSRRFLGV